MALDPQARVVLDQMAKMGNQPINELSVGQARQASAALSAMQGIPEPVAGVEDRMLSGPGCGIPVRIYMPFAKGPLPFLMIINTHLFHPGGSVPIRP